jgi:hypothetical protein
LRFGLVYLILIENADKTLGRQWGIMNRGCEKAPDFPPFLGGFRFFPVS